MFSEEAFIKLALEYGYITPENVEKCRDIQGLLPARIFIGDIMRLNGFITETQYSVIAKVLTYKEAGTQEAELTKEEQNRDREFVAILLREGFISYEDLAKFVELQKTLKQDGQVITLVEIAISHGVLWQDRSWENEYGHEADYLLWLISRGPNQGNAYVLSKKQMIIEKAGKKEVYIGRVKGADIRLNDKGVSRMHGKLIFEERTRQWEISDMMSSGGLFINDSKVNKQVLENNNIVKAGDTTLLVKID